MITLSQLSQSSPRNLYLLNEQSVAWAEKLHDPQLHFIVAICICLLWTECVPQNPYVEALNLNVFGI